MLAKMPVYEFAKTATKNVTDNLSDVWHVLWVIGVAMAICSVIPQMTVLDMHGSPQGHVSPVFVLVSLVLVAVQLVIGACLRQGWYQQILLGENKGATIGLQFGAPQKRMLVTELKVIGVMMGLSLLIMLPVTIVASVLIAFLIHPQSEQAWLGIMPFVVVAGFVALFLAVRWGLASPLTAQGETQPLKKSAQLTRGHRGRIILGGLAASVPGMIAGLVGGIVSGIIAGLLGRFVGGVIHALVMTGIGLFTMAILMNYIAEVLRFLQANTRE